MELTLHWFERLKSLVCNSASYRFGDKLMQADTSVALGSAGLCLDLSIGLTGLLEHIHRLNRVSVSSVPLHSSWRTKQREALLTTAEYLNRNAIGSGCEKWSGKTFHTKQPSHKKRNIYKEYQAGDSTRGQFKTPHKPRIKLLKILIFDPVR